MATVGVEHVVGRGRELEDLRRALGSAGGRLVTLGGPAGVGKTTLARTAMRDLSAAADWAAVEVDLASALAEGDVIAALAVALEVALDGHDDPRAAVARAAAARRALVLADNADRLDDGARRALGSLAEHGEVRILVTSREPLGVPGEILVPVEPLAEEDAANLYRSLRGGNPSPELVRALVERLDRLPLAIELAAARAPLLGDAELLRLVEHRRLDLLRDLSGLPGRTERHTTLRRAIGWSWELLEERERWALAVCARFEGPFDAGLAVAALRGASLDEVAALDVLEVLQRRALVQLCAPERPGRLGAAPSGGAIGGAGGADDERPQLRLLQAVRDFAREREGPEIGFRQWAQAVLERSEPAAAVVRRGGAIPAALSLRRPDLVILTAPESAAREPILAARAMRCLSAHLAITGPLDLVIDRAASLAGVADDPLAVELHVARGFALRAAGRHDEAALAAAQARERAGADDLTVRRLEATLLRSRGEAVAAIPLLERVAADHVGRGERGLAGIVTGEVGTAWLGAGRLDRALESHARAIAIHVAEGSRRAEGVERSYLAVATHRGGDPAAAVPIHEAALAIHREVGNRRLEGAELLHLGFVHHELAEVAAARAAFADARRVLASAGARGLEAFALVLAARLEADEGDRARARVLLAESHVAAPPGWRRLEATRHVVAGHVAFAEGSFASAAAAYASAWSTSTDVEVGFEALTPAYLALARARSAVGSSSTDADPAAHGGAPPDASLAGEARRAIARTVNPHLASALRILEGGPAPAPAAIAASSEVRRALVFAGTRRGLVVTDEGRRLSLADGREVDLGRRKSVRLVLVALARARRDHPGTPVSADDLIAAGWPGERMSAAAATKRLHTAIWTLRSLGLDALLSTEEGYHLDPRVGLRLDFEL